MLFEDEGFTYSRRYFWAYNTLTILNRDIKDIMDSFEDTFTDRVWSGEHRYIWPGTKDHSPQYADWRKRMEDFQKSFGRTMRDLETIYEQNDDLKQEIRTLRDQLFSGTSVLESRKSVEVSAVTILQGHNVKLLALVTILFLPATFVGTVFGMRNMPTEGSHRSFAIIMVLICLPFYFLIGKLNTLSGLELWQDKWSQFSIWSRNASPVIRQKESVSGESS
jgi:Mg2+ and Co2+ transporter CorA